MDVTYIYVLKCPITFAIRYVGKSNNPKRRYYSHLNINKTSSSYKRNWIKQLKENNLKPIMEVIAEVSIDNWKEYEKYYINYYKSLGCKLTNLGIGGEGLGFGNQTSFKKGTINYKKERLKKECLVCGKLFEVSPSGFNKYKCCSMSCSSVYRKKHLNKGTFSEGHIPWNKKYGPKIITYTIIEQLCKNTGNTLATFTSVSEASRLLNINANSIRNTTAGRSKSAGGYLWRKLIIKERVN